MFLRRLRACAVLTVLGGCAGGATGPATPPVADAAGETRADAGDAVVAAGCRPPRGVSGAPVTIAEAVALVNALPRPVTLTCFLESLDRPLRVDAVNSLISLQPAKGRRSPRLFVSTGKLILSVAPEGSGSALAEFGEFVDELRTVKGEIEFPVTAPLDATAPYRRLHRINTATELRGTTCAGCHRGEEEADALGFPEAYLSAAVRPVPRDRVAVDEIRAEHAACDPGMEPQRCAFLRAVFAHGPVVQWEFPAHLPTIFYER